MGWENCIHPLWGQVQVTGLGHADVNRPVGVGGVVAGASADIEWPLQGAVVRVSPGVCGRAPGSLVC